MCIYTRNNPAKFHPYLIWNDETLGCFWRALPQQEEEREREQQPDDMGYGISSWSKNYLINIAYRNGKLLLKCDSKYNSRW